MFLSRKCLPYHPAHSSKALCHLFFSNLEVVEQETAMSCLPWTSRKSLIYKWKAEDNVVYNILIKNKKLTLWVRGEPVVVFAKGASFHMYMSQLKYTRAPDGPRLSSPHFTVSSRFKRFSNLNFTTLDVYNSFNMARLEIFHCFYSRETSQNSFKNNQSYITANTTDLGFVNSELKVAWGYPTLETEAAVIWCSARKQHCSRKRKRLHCWWCVAWGWRRTNLVSYRIKVPPDWSLVSVWERVFMRCRKCWPY